jgi:hypothetical protein
MGFHRFVRGLIGRLSAALLIVLLAWPATASAPRPALPELAAAPADTDGLAPRPTTAPAVEPAIAPTGLVTPPAFEVQCPLVGFCAAVVQRVADRSSRAPVRPKAAPAVLRL